MFGKIVADETFSVPEERTEVQGPDLEQVTQIEHDR